MGGSSGQRIDRMKMTKAQNNKSTPFVSRRSGIDRRWIPSQDHQPERRRGKDRRKVRTRSFLESLDSETLKSEEPDCSDADPGKQKPTPTRNISTLVEKWTPRCLEIMLKTDSPDDE
jgi:hypothetical protein